MYKYSSRGSFSESMKTVKTVKIYSMRDVKGR